MSLIDIRHMEREGDTRADLPPSTPSHISLFHGQDVSVCVCACGVFFNKVVHYYDRLEVVDRREKWNVTSDTRSQ